MAPEKSAELRPEASVVAEFGVKVAAPAAGCAVTVQVTVSPETGMVGPPQYTSSVRVAPTKIVSVPVDGSLKARPTFSTLTVQLSEPVVLQLLEQLMVRLNEPLVDAPWTVIVWVPGAMVPVDAGDTSLP